MQNIQRPFGKFDIASPRVFKLLLSPEKFSEYTFWYVCADWNVFENGNLRTVRDSSKKDSAAGMAPSVSLSRPNCLPWPSDADICTYMWMDIWAQKRGGDIGRIWGEWGRPQTFGHIDAHTYLLLIVDLITSVVRAQKSVSPGVLKSWSFWPNYAKYFAY